MQHPEFKKNGETAIMNQKKNNEIKIDGTHMDSNE